MNSKKQALKELEAVIKEFNLTNTEVGLAITGSKSFMEWMRDPSKSIRTSTVDKVNRFVLQKRGQLELPLPVRKKK
jgi:hypothetical protein